SGRCTGDAVGAPWERAAGLMPAGTSPRRQARFLFSGPFFRSVEDLVPELCLGTPSAETLFRETEFRRLRAQTEFGHEEKTRFPTEQRCPLLGRHELAAEAVVIAGGGPVVADNGPGVEEDRPQVVNAAANPLAFLLAGAAGGPVADHAKVLQACGAGTRVEGATQAVPALAGGGVPARDPGEAKIGP